MDSFVRSILSASRAKKRVITLFIVLFAVSLAVSLSILTGILTSLYCSTSAEKIRYKILGEPIVLLGPHESSNGHSEGGFGGGVGGDPGCSCRCWCMMSGG